MGLLPTEDIVDAITSPSIWEIGASVSAIVIAILAGIEMTRIYLNRREGQNRAAARLSAIAIPVRRQINSWLHELPSEVMQMAAHLDQGLAWRHHDATAVLTMWRNWNARSGRSEISKAEKRIEDMNAEAPLTSEKTRRKVVRATAAFYGAFDKINQVMALPLDGTLSGDLTTHATREHGLLLSRGHQLLRQCTDDLDVFIDEQFSEASKQLEPSNPAAVPSAGDGSQTPRR